jgi:hypothetical protein
MAISEIEKGIGKRLELLTIEIKMGKRDFSNSIGINESQFTRMVKGTSGISPKVVFDVSSKYNVSYEWLMEGNGEIFAKEKSGPVKKPDLLTQIENYADGILISLRELKKEHQDAFQPGTNVNPGAVQRANTLDRKKTEKRPKDR